MTLSPSVQLAINGGRPVCEPTSQPVWPITTDDDVEAVVRVLRSGQLVADRTAETAVHTFEEQWARHLGVDHCVAVSNGTVALELALRAVGVRPGDEVLVPALSFVASAMAVAAVGAVPVFVDVDPVDYNIDPGLLARHVSERTRALLVVHLHGAPAPMDPIMAFAHEHGLPVVEDAAQAQGASDHGRACGSMGTVATFSLQMTKNMPTCGEGGMVVTNDEQIAEHVLRGRQFGEKIALGQPRDYRSESIGTNAKLGSVQAAYASSQLARFVSDDATRKRNVAEFLDQLQDLPHLRPPVQAADTEHAWHILRFDLDRPGPLEDVPARRRRLMCMRALSAEGVPVSRYQTLALPEQPALQPLVSQPSSHWKNASRVINQTFTLQQRHLPPTAMPVLAAYAEAFRKVFTHADQIREIDL